MISDLFNELVKHCIDDLLLELLYVAFKLSLRFSCSQDYLWLQVICLILIDHISQRSLSHQHIVLFLWRDFFLGSIFVLLHFALRLLSLSSLLCSWSTITIVWLFFWFTSGRDSYSWFFDCFFKTLIRFLFLFVLFNNDAHILACLQEWPEVLYLHHAVKELDEFVEKDLTMLCLLQKSLTCCVAVNRSWLLCLFFQICLLLSEKSLVRTKQSLMILRLILCKIVVRHLLSSFLFFSEFSRDINSFFLLVLFLEVNKEDTLYQVLIYSHLCVLILREHLH